MLTIDLTGLEDLEKQLNEVKNAVSDAKVLARQAVNQFLFREILDFARHIFEVEGIDPWEPLDEVYEARKALSHPGQTILRRDDVLYQAYTSEVTDDYGLFPDIEYAQYHETGHDNLKARPVFGQIKEHFVPNREHIKGIYRDELANQILNIVRG